MALSRRASRAGRSLLGPAMTVTVVAAGCGGQPEASALVLRVGPPSDAATVAATADVVRARLAGLETGGTVAVDGERLRLDLPPARPSSPLVGVLTDPRRLRILVVSAGAPPDTGAVDLSWERLLEVVGPVPTEAGTDETGGPTLTFGFAGADAEALAAHTAGHVGEALAFVLGDEVLAVPVIQSPITGGGLTLTLVGGDWSAARIREVAALVSSGPLPAPVVEDAGG